MKAYTIVFLKLLKSWFFVRTSEFFTISFIVGFKKVISHIFTKVPEEDYYFTTYIRHTYIAVVCRASTATAQRSATKDCGSALNIAQRMDQ